MLFSSFSGEHWGLNLELNFENLAAKETRECKHNGHSLKKIKVEKARALLITADGIQQKLVYRKSSGT